MPAKFGSAKINIHGTGSAQYPPSMMLGLLIYNYATGTFSSRRIGAQLADIKGEAYSAYGVSKDEPGVLLIQVPAKSSAARVGIEGDVIQAINGKKTPTVAVLIKTIAQLKGTPLTALCVRHQKNIKIKLGKTPDIQTEKTKKGK